MIFIFPFIILELIISIQVGISIGFGYSLAWILGTMLMGIILIQNSHIAIFSGADQLFNQKFNIKRFHDSAISNIVGGLLMVIPGVIGDSFGRTLLIY
ncbi:MAG: FxsA family protein, partial [Campylobacterales bacterium]|nr:FxsA family protein [Campylobacterales bacterium]